jgi:RNA polymerase sigma factor (sigma-70 family)
MTRPLDPEVLLRESAWLRALARSLVGDPSLADDLVQDAWVAALERPPRARAGVGPRAWLATVARNLARQRGRGAAGARARERAVARPEALPSASESVERVAAQRELVDAVLALETLERELVVLRYFEGVPPREIAARLGLSGPAVRSRLARALARLRERLDRRFEGGRAAWAALLVPAGGEPRSTPSARSTPAPLLLAGLGATAIAVIVGVQVLGKAGESAAGAPLELAAADVAPSGVGEEPRAQAAPAPAPEVATRREALEASVPPTSAPAASAGETWTLAARFVDENGVTLRGVRLELYIGRDLRADESDAAGAVRLELPWPVDPNHLAGNGQLGVKAGGHALATQIWYLRPGGPGEQDLGEIRMAPGGTLVGRVVGDARMPALVTAIGGYAPETAAGLDEARTFGGNVLGLGARYSVRSQAAADGRFTLEGVLATSVRVSATQLGRLGAISAAFPLGAGETVDVGALVLEEPGPENLVAGVLLDAAGVPVARAHVEYGEGDSSRDQGRYGMSDESGRFALVVPRGREYGLLFARDQRKRDPLLLTDVAAGTVDLVVRFPSERWVMLAARTADGTPVAVQSAFLWDANDMWLNATSEVQPDGRVRLRLPTVPFHVRLETAGWKGEPQGPLDPAALGDELVFVVTRAAGLAGRVLADGAPVAGARVHAHRPYEGGGSGISDDGFHARIDSSPIGDTETDAEGCFRITDTASGALTLHAELDGWARAELGPIELVEGVEQGGLELVLERGGALEGELLVAEGVERNGWIVGVGSGDAHVATQRLGADGRYRFERLRPGDYQVLTCNPQTLQRLEGGSYLWADPDEPVLWSTSVRAGEVAPFDLDERDRIPSRLLGELRFDGRAPSGWSANLIDGEGDVAHARLSGDGRFELRAVRPGRKWLTFVGRAGPADVRFSQQLELAPRDNPWTRDFPTGTVTLANVPAFERRKKSEAPAYCLAWREDPALVWYGSIYDPPEAAGGTLTFPGVPAGRVQLLACPADVRQGSPDANWPVVRELELVAGSHAQLTLP